jgi:hypothetical protein
MLPAGRPLWNMSEALRFERNTLCHETRLFVGRQPYPTLNTGQVSQRRPSVGNVHGSYLPTKVRHVGSPTTSLRGGIQILETALRLLPSAPNLTPDFRIRRGASCVHLLPAIASLSSFRKKLSDNCQRCISIQYHRPRFHSQQLSDYRVSFLSAPPVCTTWPIKWGPPLRDGTKFERSQPPIPPLYSPLIENTPEISLRT